MSEIIPATQWPNVEGMDDLIEIALNLHSCWNHEADEMWRNLAPELWEWTQNPWVILLTVSRDKIIALLGSSEFRSLVYDCLHHKRSSFTEKAWFQQKYPKAALSLVAYFSMEFMLTEALPIYSGGLGNVAGDQLKAASDLGVPVVGVGLLYGQGYFRQDFDADGNQQALYPVNDPGQLPIRPLRQPSGEWLRLQIRLPGSNLYIRCWEALVGRTKLYLLDTNDFANTPAQRGITSELYGGDAEMRLKQEMVLGIAGWRLLRALGLNPDVCHLNEGHAAFAILERARCYMEDHKTSFELALAVTRAGNLFTTHTAVTAGFDRFSPDLMHKHLHRYTEEELSVPLEDVLALGRQNAGDTQEPFNMAYLAMRGSGRINGVSKLHGQVSRHIFQPLFPRWPEWEVPVGSVTNGVHVPTWDSAEADALWTEACGQHRWSGEKVCPDKIRGLSDEQLWKLRSSARKNLIDRVRVRYARQRASGYNGPEDLPQMLDEHVLTVGFARRFATYKRPNFLLHDRERLIRLLTNPERPMQLILAGKAHPADKPGQALIKQWNDFIEESGMAQHVVFLSDYDMFMAQELVQGTDLWINTPRRPWEACGTSGMKTLVNGGLNFSELDGWWAEAYSPEVGWAIGDGQEHGDDPAWDDVEAEEMYRLLEQEVVPEFYERGDNGMPSKWLSRVRESMARLTPEFSASRAIQNYTEEHYLPAASGYRLRVANNSAVGAEVVAWLQKIARGWHTVHFGGIHVETRDGRHFFEAQVWPGELSRGDLRVELYADPHSGQGAEIVTMTAGDPDAKGLVHYRADIAANRAPGDYTARVVPQHANVALPLEADEILWQR